jgi:hypothetical protein
VSWLAVLLSLASLCGSPAPVEVKSPAKKCTVAKHCTSAKSKPKKKSKPKTKPRKKPATSKPGSGTTPESTSPTRQAAPDATPVPVTAPKPGATPTPTPTPTPAPGVKYPSRTGVDLTDIREWAIRSSYRTLAAGTIDFNVNNLGEDEHNLSIRRAGTEYGGLDLAPSDSGTLTLTLGVGTYVLYCSLLGHEAAGMRSSVSVR